MPKLQCKLHVSVRLLRDVAVRTAALAAVLTVAGCGGTDPQDPAASQRQTVLNYARQAQEAGQDDQYQVLRDGEVSRSEYETQVDIALNCNRDKGRDTYEPWINPVDGLTILYDFLPGEGIPLDEADSGQDCETLHTTYVQGAYLATHEARMAEPLRAYVAECAGSGGAVLTGAESSLARFVQSAGEGKQQVVLDCVDRGLRELYPEQPLYFVTY